MTSAAYTLGVSNIDYDAYFHNGIEHGANSNTTVAYALASAGISVTDNFPSFPEGIWNVTDPYPGIEEVANVRMAIRYSISKGLDSGEITYQEFGEALKNWADPSSQILLMEALTQAESNCFLSTTPILMSDSTQKPIEDIKPGDMVKSYDKDGNLVSGHVKQIFVKEVEHVLDFFGTGVTPGHVYLCSAGKFKGQHVPLIDILGDDGGVVAADGTLIRAATGTPIGSENDVKKVWAVRGTKTSDGGFQISERKKIRLSTRVITEAGSDLSVADILKGVDVSVNENAMIQVDQNSDVEMPFRWTLSESLPEPEDYVLRRSGLTLAEICEAAAWEGMPLFSSMAIQ